MILIAVGVVGIAIIIQLSVVIGIEHYQRKKNSEFLRSCQTDHGSSNILVAYFSRTGNTELMAHKIAELKKATLHSISTDEYKIGFKGWMEAMLGARKTKTNSGSLKMDLSAYDTIYIGSPIWLYSPAPPAFEFAKDNDFTGKKVILFNSLNSKFEQEYVDRFSAIIAENGGHMIRHIYIVRGRMTQQMDQQVFLDSVEKKVLHYCSKVSDSCTMPNNGVLIDGMISRSYSR